MQQMGNLSTYASEQDPNSSLIINTLWRDRLVHDVVDELFLLHADSPVLQPRHFVQPEPDPNGNFLQLEPDMARILPYLPVLT